MTGRLRPAVLAAAGAVLFFTALYAQADWQKEAMKREGWLPPYTSATAGPDGALEWFSELVFSKAKWEATETCDDHYDAMGDFLGLHHPAMYWAEDGS